MDLRRACVEPLAVMSYSGCLGGEMVYQRGVGVQPAEGVRRRPALPQLERKTAVKALRRAGAAFTEGLKRTAQETAKGDLVPALRRR